VFLTSTFHSGAPRKASDSSRSLEERASLRAAESGWCTAAEHPNLEIFEARMARWDRTERSAAFASGMAAISTSLLAVLSPGDWVLSSSPIYGGTHSRVHASASALRINVHTEGSGAEAAAR